MRSIFFLFMARAVADVHLTADDGMNADLLHGFVEVDGAIEVSVVCQGDRWHSECFGRGGNRGDGKR